MRHALFVALLLTGTAWTAGAQGTTDTEKVEAQSSPPVEANKAVSPPVAATQPPDTDAASASEPKSTDGPVGDDPVSPAAVPKDRMPALTLAVKPAEASVGEIVSWQLTVKRKKEDSVHLEGGASFGGLEIKSKDKSETPGPDGWVMETLTVSLVGFDPGDITIPKQKLTVVDFEGHLAEITTEESFVSIKSLIANEPEPKLKEDTGQGETVLEKDYLLLWILGIIGGIALVAVMTLVGRKLWSMRRPKPAPPPPPPRPAEEIANAKLEALRLSNLLAEGDIKEFHVRLSEAIREYLGNRFHFDSLELSSEELILAIRKINLTRTEYELILDFLGETDLVKFAKSLPTVQESEDLLTQSFGFVERTTPKTAPTAPAEKPTPENKEAGRA